MLIPTPESGPSNEFLKALHVLLISCHGAILGTRKLLLILTPDRGPFHYKMQRLTLTAYFAVTVPLRAPETTAYKFRKPDCLCTGGG